MTERLDRIEAMLLAMTERQNETTATLAQTNATLAQTNATLVQTNTTLDRLAERQVRQADEIDTLLGAVSTNEVSIRELVAQISESNQRFEVLRQEAIADRQHSDQRFEVLRQEAIADRQHSDQRSEELRQEAIADRQKSDQRFEAMQENIQRLLLEMHRTNRRVDTLEQAG
ncbi:MAG: hypothetical protein AAGC93_26665 [Cyanobacteria bacterium P01_F01_bin.53]